MDLKMIYALISLVLCLLGPVVYVVYLRKVKGIKISLWDVVAGISGTFLGKYVLFSLLCSLIVSLFPNVFSSSLSYSILSIIMTWLMIIVCIFLFDRLMYKGQMRFENGAGFALGATIADLLNSILMAALSNVIYLVQIRNGSIYENLLNSLNETQAAAVIETYNAYPASYFLYIGIIAIAMLSSNYLVSMLMCCYDNDKKQKQYILFLMLAVLIFTVVYYYLSPLSLYYANLSLIFIAFLQFVLAKNAVRFH